MVEDPNDATRQDKRHKKYRLEGIHMLRVGRTCQIKGAEGSVAGLLTPESSD